jgi:uncharacterized protein YcgI (DUF1989 family)
MLAPATDPHGGEVGESILVPAREGRAIEIPRETRFRIVDVEGGQVVDLFAFVARDVDEYLSAEHTRVYVNRLFPRVGQVFVTNRRASILSFEEDASPGVHDMLFAACDPIRYRLLGVEGWHASCQENLESAMRELGFPQVKTPQPANLFMSVRFEDDGTIALDPAPTKAGDSVTFRAELDTIVVASACPQDLNEINHFNPTPVAIEILA